ncbi:TolB-like translocation protein [Microlunatus antarcticus]|uniref:WD40-like Beta Propeller Repeat n=1 Tax=Microlunatus antarcticus TaxID=53388 RepID=A0A7W5JY70_9ACTN|nr:hypothetical protein [Microlunatus antarcticus]MBB3328498.1 hypothetical protein [Microlunatus antarcticus]
MTRRRRWTLALLLCGVGAGILPVPAAVAAPAVDAGVGSVVADLGTVPYGTTRPGFSVDGAYYASLVVSGDRCDVHVYDLARKVQVGLTHAHVACGSGVRWAADADTLVWSVNAAGGDVTVYAWDADPGQVTVLAPDAHVYTVTGVSGDGRYLSFTGRSDAHPAPAVDAPREAGFVYDRAGGVSLPLSGPDRHVQLLEWAPRDHRFTGWTGGRTSYDQKTGSCFGTGTACDVLDPHVFFGDDWSRDGTAVVGEDVLGGGSNVMLVHDFTDGSSTAFPTRAGYVDFARFVGPGADKVLGNLRRGTALWDRTRGTVVRTSDGSAVASPTGQYLLVGDDRPDAYRYRDLSSGASAPATYRGTGGYWTRDGSSYVGAGPGGCSSLRQWSPATNTVSLFGPPGLSTCYRVYASSDPGHVSSASGRFAIVQKEPTGGTLQPFVADLRRHTLAGPLTGWVDSFAPAGADVLPVHQRLDAGTERLLLVDLTPVPDVDDKPRWSAATPATGASVEVAVGGQVRVQLGASDLQQTPVNLSFRWRTDDGTPVASAPKGWSCERRRLAAGATVADCTFAPPKDFTAVRYLDVSATNVATGAQSDTRSYRVGVGPT